MDTSLCLLALGHVRSPTLSKDQVNNKFTNRINEKGQFYSESIFLPSLKWLSCSKGRVSLDLASHPCIL